MHPILDFWHQRFHDARAELFVRSMRPVPGETLLDLGGGDGSFAARICRLVPLKVTVADLGTDHRERVRARGFEHVVLPESATLPFASGQFDLVLSNSVIEHVTLPKERCRIDVSVPEVEWEQLSRTSQQAFAWEIARVGRRYFVQTPHKHFPIDPHVYLPFVQYLPRDLLCKVMAVTDGRWVNDCQRTADWHLLDPQSMQHLFPQAAVRVERFLGLPKSIVAYTPCAP